MKMQDNEFDDVFRSKLDGFEADPSGKVWAGIDQELSSADRRRLFIPILRIAASVIIVATAGILFIPRKGNVKPGAGTNNAIVKSVVPAIKEPDVTAPVKQAEQVATVRHQPSVKRTIRLTAKTKIREQVIAVQKLPVVNPTPEPVKLVEQPQMITSVQTQKPAEITQPVVPGSETPLTTKAIASSTDEPKLTTQTIAQVPAKEQPAQPSKRRGIHNFGDLVNMVVARVDKRKDKALEFADSDDDDGTNLVAVNIGPVKIKKDK